MHVRATRTPAPRRRTGVAARRPVYARVPAANRAIKIAKAVYAEGTTELKRRQGRTT